MRLISWLLCKLARLWSWIVSCETSKATDLNIVIRSKPFCPTEGVSAMTNKRATGTALKCPCLKTKGGKSAVMSPITLTTAPGSITLQPVDASGSVVFIQSGDNVTGTLSSSDANLFPVSPGSDSLHWEATIPANTPVGTQVTLSATLTGTMGGNSVNFTASVDLTINITPPAPVAVDLTIIVG